MRLIEADYCFWHNVEKDGLPEKEGQYLCAFNLDNYKGYDYQILDFTKNAYKLDEYDFEEYAGKKKSLFYYYSSEWGYIECDDVVAWMEIPLYKEESEE